ncbi:MAG: hypothetical protein JW885_15765 [Deltaproteobacteria bacterium]|nr:hypothetical protein [Candidatus Zymogenaceae bacterium]
MIRIITTRRFLKTTVGAALFVMVCFVAGFSSLGEESRSVPARAVELSGSVKVNYAGENIWRELFRMERVRDADRVFTGPDGEVSLKCKDDTLITLSPMSGVEIEELSVVTRDGEETAVTAVILTQGRVDITAPASDRYESEITLAAPGLRLASKGDGRAFSAAVEYVPETEAVGVDWSGGDGIMTVSVEHPGTIEMTFGADTAGNVSFSREASPDSGEDSIVLTVAVRPMDASIDAVIDRIVIGDDGRVILSGRTAGSGVSIFTGEGGTIPVEGEEGSWTAELVFEGGESFSPGPIALGSPGDMPDIPTGGEREGTETFRGSEKRPNSSFEGEPGPPIERRDVSRIARSFLEDFIDAVEEGDTTALSGLIDFSYSGIGGSRYGLIDMVREYFETADFLRITWSFVSIDQTEDTIITTISWSSSAGTSGVSTFWLSDGDNPSLSHAEGDWFF